MGALSLHPVLHPMKTKEESLAQNLTDHTEKSYLKEKIRELFYVPLRQVVQPTDLVGRHAFV